MISGIRGRQALLLLILVLLCAAPYLRALPYPFHFDDITVIVNNSGLRVPGWGPADLSEVFRQAPPGINRRPVAQLSFLLNFRMTGLDPSWFRAFNLAVHLINVILVYFLATLLLPTLSAISRRRLYIVSLFAAALWGAHPIQTQAVTYIVQRATSMMTMFFLGGVVCYLIARKSPGYVRIIWLITAGLLGLLAFGTKESAAVFPFVLLLLELALRAGEGRRLWTVGNKAAAGALVGLTLVLSGYFLTKWDLLVVLPEKGFSPWQRLLSQGRVLWLYISLVLWPLPGRLSIDRDFAISHEILEPGTTLPAWLGILSIAGWAVFNLGKKPFASLAILWFLGTQAIEASFIPLDLVYEHRLYLPTVLPAIWFSFHLSRLLGPHEVRDLQV